MYKKGNNMTLMDRKKTFGKRVIRNNVEIMNQLPNEEGGYDYNYQQHNAQMPEYSQMNPQDYAQAEPVQNGPPMMINNQEQMGNY